MQQDAGISHVLRAVGPSAPFVFNAEVIVSIGIDGGQISHASTEMWIMPSSTEYSDSGSPSPGILKPRRETGQVFSVEGSNDLVTGRDGNDFGMGIRSVAS